MTAEAFTLIDSVVDALAKAESHLDAQAVIKALRQALREEASRLCRDGIYVRSGVYETAADHLDNALRALGEVGVETKTPPTA